MGVHDESRWTHRPLFNLEMIWQFGNAPFISRNFCSVIRVLITTSFRKLVSFAK